jgi:hypothetical protein
MLSSEENNHTTSFTSHISLKCNSFGASLNSFHEGKFNGNLHMMVLKENGSQN